MNDTDRRRRLEALFHAHAAAVWAYAARRADAGTADDITSDVFVIAWRRLDDVPEDALMLIAWEGLDAGQAATVIGCTRRALTMRLHRARRRLAAALASADPARTDPMEAM